MYPSRLKLRLNKYALFFSTDLAYVRKDVLYLIQNKGL